MFADDADLVLAGHGRLEAARLEGLTHAPIIRFGHLTEAQKRAYVIADNKLAEQAGWDREILAIELGELIDLLPAEGFGKHRLLCGNAREAADFARLMEGASASAVFCDPPYNLRVSEIGGRGRVRHPEFAFASGEMAPAQFRKFLLETLANGVRVSA